MNEDALEIIDEYKAHIEETIEELSKLKDSGWSREKFNFMQDFFEDEMNCAEDYCYQYYCATQTREEYLESIADLRED